jgi:hypothetical protein
MDWKRWYRGEIESDAGREAVTSALARWPDGDPAVRRALRGRGAASFPHTTLRGSAEPLARVATSIVAEQFRRVLALGVLHGSTAPEPWRSRFAAAAEGDVRARASVEGAFTPTDAIATPFGRLVSFETPAQSTGIRPTHTLLESEFSLDLFLATLAAAAKARGVTAPAVSRVYVGLTMAHRGNDASLADVVALALRPLLDEETALVATGDLVHAGHGYSTAAEAAALPTEPTGLASHFQGRAQQMLDGALQGGPSLLESDAIAREIRSDQRHVLPVLAAMLGHGARARMLSFELTDYAPILGEPPPCVVASALVAFERRLA